MREAKRSNLRLAIILGLMIPYVFSTSIHAAETQTTPAPKVITTNVPDKDYLQLIAGPPESITMRSGCVILAPGGSVGKHSTRDNNEEMLVILEGQGEMRITGGETLPLNNSVVAYCPPHREHDVFNTGHGPLRYIYIVARARQ